MRDVVQELKSFILDAENKLKLIEAEEASIKPSPDKWSKKEILGHLIDSAVNNHHRIVRAQYNAAANFPGYDQNEWVKIQRYNDMEWQPLVELWSAYNNHLSQLIEQIPVRHETSLCNVGKEDPVTLKFVVEDYLRHLKHHLDDILKMPI